MQLNLSETANRRITNIEPQPATSSAESNIEGWFRSAQSFINDNIPSFDPPSAEYSLFDIRFLEFLLSIKLAAPRSEAPLTPET